MKINPNVSTYSANATSFSILSISSKYLISGTSQAFPYAFSSIETDDNSPQTPLKRHLHSCCINHRLKRINSPQVALRSAVGDIQVFGITELFKNKGWQYW